MSFQPSVQNADTGTVAVPTARTLMRRHRMAQVKLASAFENRRPVVLMIGDDSFELGLVTGAFVRSLDERTTAVRLRQPQANALAAFAEINRAIGFDPKDLTLSDLQNVLTLFLEHQCNHGHRTVLSIEKADEQSMWLLDCVARLLRATESRSVGRSLLVVLSGPNRLNGILRNPAFDVIRKKAELPVRLPPFSIFETREFLRQLSNTAGFGDVRSLLEFDAVERLHSISGGVPHIVARLFRECVSIVNEKGSRSATPKVVVQAARNLRKAGAVDTRVRPAKPPVVQKSRNTARQLLIRCPDQPLKELALTAGRFMVGRSGTADIQLPSPTVSRRHALLIDSGDAVQVLDLGSTNGTFAGTRRISETTLKPGAVLKLGDCEIEYLVN